MRILTSMDLFDGQGCVVALGTFDGVHAGHAQLLKTTVSLSKEYGLPAVALTFDRHPLSLIRPQDVPPPLTDNAERAALIAALGIDVLIEEPFTPAFAALQPEEYLSKIAHALRPAAIVAGFNHTFGRGGRGGADLIRAMAAPLHYRAVIAEPVLIGGEVVSSTRIRRLLAQGDTQTASLLLGRDVLSPEIPGK